MKVSNYAHVLAYMSRLMGGCYAKGKFRMRLLNKPEGNRDSSPCANLAVPPGNQEP